MILSGHTDQSAGRVFYGGWEADRLGRCRPHGTAVGCGDRRLAGCPALACGFHLVYARFRLIAPTSCPHPIAMPEALERRDRAPRTGFVRTYEYDTGLRFSPHGQFVSASADNTLKLWDVESCEPLMTLRWVTRGPCRLRILAGWNVDCLGQERTRPSESGMSDRGGNA